MSEPQRRRQLLATGLIVWLDPKGGKAQKFGIQIAGSGFVRPDRADGTSIPNPYEDEPARVPRQEPAQPKLTRVDLLGPGKDDRPASSCPATAASMPERRSKGTRSCTS